MLCSKPFSWRTNCAIPHELGLGEGEGIQIAFRRRRRRREKLGCGVAKIGAHFHKRRERGREGREERRNPWREKEEEEEEQFAGALFRRHNTGAAGRREGGRRQTRSVGLSHQEAGWDDTRRRGETVLGGWARSRENHSLNLTSDGSTWRRGRRDRGDWHVVPGEQRERARESGDRKAGREAEELEKLRRTSAAALSTA